MTNTAHFTTPEDERIATLVVYDERGTPIVERELPSSVTEPEEVEDDLKAAGCVRTADWTDTDDGWTAPVVVDGDAGDAS